MNERTDIVIPSSVLLNRLRAHREELVRKLNSTSWWRFRTSNRISGAIATYDYEIECLNNMISKAPSK